MNKAGHRYCLLLVAGAFLLLSCRDKPLQTEAARPQRPEQPAAATPPAGQPGRVSAQGAVLELPPGWRLDYTVFYNPQGKKVAEFAPGLLTTREVISGPEFVKRKRQAGPDIEAEETTMSFDAAADVGPVILATDSLTLGSRTWLVIENRDTYEGPEGSGTWYPVEYFTRVSDHQIFIITYYARQLPGAERTQFEQMLRTLHF